jgi:propanediol dehydratase small subunit
MFATALTKLNGVTVESIVAEYLNTADQGIDLEALKTQAQAAVDTIKGTSMQQCNGKLTGSVEAEIIDTLGVEVK